MIDILANTHNFIVTFEIVVNLLFGLFHRKWDATNSLYDYFLLLLLFDLYLMNVNPVLSTYSTVCKYGSISLF